MSCRNKEYWNKYYQEHREARRASAYTHYWRNREAIKANARADYLRNRDERIKIQKQYRDAHIDIKKVHDKERRLKYKLAVLDAYGGRMCCWCKDVDLLVLVVDHINNNGAEHRKQLSSGSAIYKWLYTHNFPPGFQILCASCNQAKALNNGVLPNNRRDIFINKWTIEEAERACSC